MLDSFDGLAPIDRDPTLRLSLLLAVLVPTPALGQGPGPTDQPILPLATAIARADSHGYANRAAGAGLDLRSAQKASTLRGILPTLRAELGYFRTTDPLNAFGFTLRQRSVTQASFSPDALNYPEATGNLATGLIAELPLINADIWAGRSAASTATQPRRPRRDGRRPRAGSTCSAPTSAGCWRGRRSARSRRVMPRR